MPMLTAIASGLDGRVTGLRNGWAVRSPSHGQMYYIAAEIVGPGLTGAVGLWASNSLQPGEGLVLSVDGLARTFSEWPDGRETQAHTSIADAEATIAKRCAGG